MTAPGTVEEQIALVRAAAAQPDRRCVSRVLGNHADVTVVAVDRHRWSPCVHLEFRQSDEDTIIDGLIGPPPNTWTLFAFVSITIALAIIFGLMTGLVQLQLEQPACSSDAGTGRPRDAGRPATPGTWRPCGGGPRDDDGLMPSAAGPVRTKTASCEPAVRRPRTSPASWSRRSWRNGGRRRNPVFPRDREGG